jgi:hypothetical protein
MRKTRVFLLAGACALAATGCRDRKMSGQDAVYTNQPWIAVAAAAVCLALAVAGVVLLLRKDWGRGFLLTVLGVAGLVACPGPVLARVEIGPDRLYSHTGFWLFPDVHDIRLSEVMRAEVDVDFLRAGRNYYYLKLWLRSGQSERIWIGDLFKKAFPEVVKRLRQRNITVDMPPDLDDELARAVEGFDRGQRNISKPRLRQSERITSGWGKD